MTSKFFGSVVSVALAASLSACALSTDDGVPDTETTETAEQDLLKACPAIAILCAPGYLPKQLPNCRQICVPDNGPPSGGECAVGGCSGEICYDPSEGSAVSICIWKPEYACYDTATCERQQNGTCGWTETPELTECLAQASEPQAL